MMEFKYIQSAEQLPDVWDELAENYFQQKLFLSHIEKFNPCKQRYYLCVDDGKLISGAIAYSIHLDLFTFIKIKSPLKMNIIGIPCSVSSSGIFGSPDAINTLKTHIFHAEKGFVLILNLENKPDSTTYASGNTLPTVVFDNCYTDWEAYLKSLRSAYRRRLKLINQHTDGIHLMKKSCSVFTGEMYQQYLDVYNRSNGKLEKLSLDFFKQLPPEFILTICCFNDDVIGWNITLSAKNTFYFFLGGINYKMNKIHNTYFRLLSSIIKDGIDNKSKNIDLGQTAEIPKIRLGGKLVLKYMEAHHSNLIFNKILKLFKVLLEYKRTLENTHSLKEKK